MKINRRNAISITAAGLIHIAAKPEFLWGHGESSKEWTSDFVVRQAKERGHTDLGWLQSYHSFSFGTYYDQRHLGFQSLRVINDDRVAPGRGFPAHPHRNMEIISYVLEGSLKHKDSTGEGAVVTPDDIQLMSTGRGITHSEYNPSRRQESHFLQIWIDPAIRGSRPRYSDKKVSTDQKRKTWKRIVGPDGSDASVTVRQDAQIHATVLKAKEELAYTVEKNRHAWLQVARGSLSVNGTRLNAGDAVATSRTVKLHVTAHEPTDALLFDLGSVS